MHIKETWSVDRVFKSPISFHKDTTVAEALANSKQFTARNEDINIKYHLVKAALLSNIFHLYYRDTKENPRDILTKVLDHPR